MVTPPLHLPLILGGVMLSNVFLGWLVIFAFIHLPNWAQENNNRTKPWPQTRRADETWRQALERNFRTHVGPFELHSENPLKQFQDSAAGVSKPLIDIHLEQIKEWPLSLPPITVFEFVRNDRYLSDPDVENFLRRITWLYPDDGCSIRAALALKKIEDTLLASLQRVYLFGNLLVNTSNHPQGHVRWWYHTALVTRYNGVIYLFDPAIEPQHLITLDDWLTRQDQDISQSQISICHGYTYNVTDPCDGPLQNPGQEALENIKGFLSLERQRQVWLSRDPGKVLGDEPPWANTQSGFGYDRSAHHFLFLNP